MNKDATPLSKTIEISSSLENKILFLSSFKADYYALFNSVAPRHHPKICHKIWWEKLQVWKSELLKLNGFPIKLWRLNVKDEAREENSSSACLDNKTKTSHCKAFTSPSRLWDSYHLYRQHWIKFGPIDIQHMTLQPINRIVIFCFWIEQTMTHYDLFFKA